MHNTPNSENATEQLGQAMCVILKAEGANDTTSASDGPFVEVDPRHGDLWVHELSDDMADTVVETVKDYATEATDVFGAALLFDVSVGEPPEADGKTVSVSDIRFN